MSWQRPRGWVVIDVGPRAKRSLTGLFTVQGFENSPNFKNRVRSQGILTNGRKMNLDAGGRMDGSVLC